jgi:prepilin-type N-terminal cleavage/methylation domain-containing protein
MPVHLVTHCLKNRGFTLIEMAIVLIILTLVIGSALVPLGAQIEQRQRAETQKSLDEAKEALIGYALTNNKLPCPASATSNGLEQREPSGICTGSATSTTSVISGYLPWSTLGLNRQDAWGNLIRYAASKSFTDTPILLTAVPSITIRSRDLNGTAFDLSSGIPAAVFSNGKNGYGALSADGITQPGVPGNNPDEKRNITPNSASYYSRTPAPAGTSTTLGGEFDDMVVWISPNILFNRMVAAGKLP